MKASDLYTNAHLIVSAIRILEHRKSAPPSVDAEVPVIGASGAIFGLIAVMLLLMPFKVTTALLLPLPGVVMGLLLVLIEVAAVMVSVESGVAHDMHLYGFFVGCFGARDAAPSAAAARRRAAAASGEGDRGRRR